MAVQRFTDCGSAALLAIGFDSGALPDHAETSATATSTIVPKTTSEGILSDRMISTPFMESAVAGRPMRTIV